MYEGLVISLLIVLAGIASLELDISTAILEVVAGVIAANLLGICNYNAAWLEFLANFGLLGLMFFAGFEIDREVLGRHFKRGLVVSSSSYFIPFVLVFLVAHFFFSFDPRASALMAIALSTTSLALVYSILRERKLLAKEAGQVLLASSMLIDILSMLSLSLIFVSFEYEMIAYLVVLAIAIYAAPKLGRYILSRYKGNVIELEVRFLLLLILSLAFLADRLHVSSAIVVFVVGFILSELLREHEALVEKLKGIMFGFMAPLFFFYVGVLTNLGIMDLYLLAFTLSMGLLAYLSKYGGVLLSMDRYYGRDLATLSGHLFNHRLGFGTIVAVFGLEAGMIPDGVYSSLITIILAASIASCLFLKVKVREF